VLATREPICAACSIRRLSASLPVESTVAIVPERLKALRAGFALELHRPIETTAFTRLRLYAIGSVGLDRRKMNIQLIANVENKHRAQCG
jgi:hypothetical protein